MGRGRTNTKGDSLLFFESLANKLGIHNPKDWGKVPKRTVNQYGGDKILKLHNNSLWRSLRNCYPSSFCLST